MSYDENVATALDGGQPVRDGEGGATLACGLQSLPATCT